MAIQNKLDPLAIAERLAAWLPEVLHAAGDVTLSDLSMPVASGMSSETILFDATWEADGQRISKGMVARVPPSGQRLFNDYDIAREGRVMAAMARHSDAAMPLSRYWGGASPPPQVPSSSRGVMHVWAT